MADEADASITRPEDIAVESPVERPDDRIGKVLGVYRFVEFIGQGGMGWVYRGEHIHIGREVGLKLLRPRYARRRRAVARFFKEARAVSRIRHPNIVDVTDFVELDEGTSFIVMELLRGASLAALLDQGPIEPRRALMLMIQVTEGLVAAHRAGVVHRDLKPDNIFIARSGETEVVKLLDFGVAKLLDRDDDLKRGGVVTEVGSVIGTLGFMSPEQARGDRIDERSDLYSVGAIMYLLFTGQPLFAARSPLELLELHRSATPRPPRQAASDLDPRVERIILRCLEPDREARYPSARALRDDLRALLLDPAPVVVAEPVEEERRRRPALLVFAAGVAIAAVAGLVMGLELGSPAAPAAASGPGDAGAREASADSGSPAGAPAPVRVHFSAEQPATVSAAGSGEILCSTPCSLAVDPGDGGFAERREFVIRRDGFLDQVVSVDLGLPVQSVHVALQPAPPRRAAKAERRAAGPRTVSAPRTTSTASKRREPPAAAEPRSSREPVPPHKTLNPFDRPEK